MADQPNKLAGRGTKLALATALATALAIPAEGIRQTAYYDPPGILTACRGHTGADVRKGVTYSLAQCDAWMTDDMRKAVGIVDRCAPGLPPEVLAAFSDAVFNMGPTIACDTANSSAARYLYRYARAVYKDAATGQTLDAKRTLSAACEQLPRWNKARVAGVLVPLPGLTTRRGNERDLCLQGAA
jgi:GH24 family phage-related lysozyme (muramidase)